MIDLKNIFCKTNPAIVKLSLALRTFIGTISTAAYFQDKPGLAFWLLVSGALIDLLLQMLPENVQTKDGTKTLFLIGWLIAATMLLSGCKILRPASERSLVDTTTITYKPVDFEVKGAKVNQAINYDSLYTEWRKKNPINSLNNKPSEKQKVTDPQTKAQLTYWIDEYGKLQVGCESKDQTIQMLVAETNRLRSEKQKAMVLDYKTPVTNWIVMSVLATLLVISLIINLILFKR